MMGYTITKRKNGTRTIRATGADAQALFNAMTPKNAFEEAKQYTGKSTNFGNMDPIKRSEIARMGGRASHETGKAHEFNSETARAAALKSWEVRRAKKAGAYQP